MEESEGAHYAVAIEDGDWRISAYVHIRVVVPPRVWFFPALGFSGGGRWSSGRKVVGGELYGTVLDEGTAHETETHLPSLIPLKTNEQCSSVVNWTDQIGPQQSFWRSSRCSALSRAIFHTFPVTITQTHGGTMSRLSHLGKHSQVKPPPLAYFSN